MLEDLDTSRFVPNSVFKTDISRLETDLGVLHRQSKEMGVPIIILFEGWDASGKASTINKVLMAMDPRNYTVYPIYAPNDEESSRPFLWRFWTKTPPKGRIAIFDRSWYIRVSDDRVARHIKRAELPRAYDQINAFERTLTDDGTLIIKFFLHITKKEQERRLKLLQEGAVSPWRYLPQNWDHHKRYDEFLEAYEDMLVRTHTKWGPWNALPAHDPKYAAVTVFKTIISSMEKRRQELLITKEAVTHHKQAPLEEQIPPTLANFVLGQDMGKDEYESELKELQERIASLQLEVYRRKVPVIIAYNGWDASGKGGAIKRLVQILDPRGYKVVPIIVPTDEEKAHNYLWRFWKELPEAGNIAIFDRTWYGRVLVERVEGFCTEEEWKRAYWEINEMEAQWAEWGAVLVKFWLHIDKDTQLERFNERMRNPYKRWKITDEDWRNRAKWDDHLKAAEEMFYRTNTSVAPWTIVDANSKYHSRIMTLRTVADAISKRL